MLPKRLHRPLTKPISMIAIGGVRYTMVDFVLQPLGRAGLHLVPNKNA